MIIEKRILIVIDSIVHNNMPTYNPLTVHLNNIYFCFVVALSNCYDSIVHNNMPTYI